MRYVCLIILNLPVVALALTNLVTQYKMKKISPRRFRWQLVIWLAIIALLTLSFPAYNVLSGRHVFDSEELSLFDIAEITAIVWLFYTINYQRQRIAQHEIQFQKLHKEISIRLSKKD